MLTTTTELQSTLSILPILMSEDEKDDAKGGPVDMDPKPGPPDMDPKPGPPDMDPKPGPPDMDPS